jgi:dihydroneopterin aldolase
MTTLQIRLADLRCTAFHGIHPEERRAGQPFVTHITLALPAREPISDIAQTVDYTRVYALFRQTMAEPEPLLETVAAKLADRIRQAFPDVSEINISIDKTSPPIATFEGRIGIAYRWQHDNP